MNASFFARMTVVLPCLIGLFSSSGCQLLQRVAENTRQLPPSRPHLAGKLDVAPLIETRLQIPPRPIRPQPPRLSPGDVEKLANKPATVRSTGGVAFEVTDRELVAVLGREQLVGLSSAAGQFISDLLFAELMRRGTRIADRDYRVVKLSEYDDIVSEGLINLTPQELARIQLGEQQAVRYYIVVHAVKVPNNPVVIEVPWRVTSEDWNAYVRDRDEYLAAVVQYNKAVQRYEDELFQYAVRADPNDVFVEGEENGHQTGPIRLEELAGFVETRPKVVKKRESDRASRAAVYDEQQLRSAMAASTAFGNAQPAYAQNYFNRLSLTRYAAGRPNLVTGDELKVYRTPEEVVVERTTPAVQHVSVFQGAVSVRVIDLTTSFPVWFGLASSQDLDYTEAMAKSCGALADAMIGKAKTGD